MTGPADQPTLRAWADAHQYWRIASELVRLEESRGVIDLAALSDDPEGALSGNSEVQVEYDTAPKPGCSVYGYYRPRSGAPALILVHPALSSERDNFTIVHEVGHHVQRQHRAWANVRFAISGAAGDHLEERVADAFAAEVLIPVDADADGTWLDARVLAQVHGRVRASRSAVAMRAVEIAPEGESAAVVVADRNGLVTFARASGDDVYAPARGSVQPGIAALIQTAFAGDGYAAGALTDGVRFGSGWAQQDLRAEAALDGSWNHAFVVIRPDQRFGRTRVWEQAEAECPSEACGTVFVIDAGLDICPKCSTPKCPECRSCACEPELTPTCNRCFTLYSIAERANPALHECPF